MFKRILVVALLLICGVCVVEAQWEDLTQPLGSPSESMIIDTNRHILILYGSDWVYEWDGKVWSKHLIPFDQTGSYGHEYSVVYDENIKRTLIFGGFDIHDVMIDGEYVQYFTYHDETRLWDGKEWELLSIEGPSARAGSSIGYDPNRQVTVLFGGVTGHADVRNSLGDTWEFDGSSWQSAKISGPPPSSNGMLIYNPNSKRMLLVGINAGNYQDHRTMWEWDGHQWEKVGLIPDTINSSFFNVVSDRENKQVIFFFNSIRAGSPEVWRLNSDYTFERLWIKENPQVVVGHNFVFDPDTGNIYMFGRILAPKSYYENNLWKLNLAKYSPPQQKLWNQINSSQEGPEGKCTLIYDERNENIMAFDGKFTWTMENDNWINHGQIGPGRWGTAPGESLTKIDSRFDYLMVYHAGLEAVLLVAGRGKGGYTHDEWLWDGNEWKLLKTVPAFSNRFTFMKAVYDSRNNRLIAHGDYYYRNRQIIETWMRDSKGWTKIRKNENPPLVWLGEWANMVYDSSNAITYYFEDINRYFKLHSKRWREFEYQDTYFTVGSGSTLVFHPKLKRILLLCGYERDSYINRHFTHYFNEVRFWNGTYWEILPSATLPTPRKFAGAAYNEKTGALILAGGIGPDGKPLHDTWRMKLPKKNR